MDRIPSELIEMEMLMYFTVGNVLSYCATNCGNMSICKDKVFWRMYGKHHKLPSGASSWYDYVNMSVLDLLEMHRSASWGIYSQLENEAEDQAYAENRNEKLYKVARDLADDVYLMDKKLLKYIKKGRSGRLSKKDYEDLDKLLRNIRLLKRNASLMGIVYGDVKSTLKALPFIKVETLREFDRLKKMCSKKRMSPSKSAKDQKRVMKQLKSRSRAVKRLKGSGKKSVRKHRGVYQSGPKKGKLKPGFRYSGRKLKSGLSEIVSSSKK